MSELNNYPENRLDIRVDVNGNVTYQQNPVFAKYYAPTREEKEEELAELRERLELLELDEPEDDEFGEYEDWADEKRALEDDIEALEAEIAEMQPSGGAEDA